MLSDGVRLAVCFSIHPKGVAWGSGLSFVRDGSVLQYQIPFFYKLLCTTVVLSSKKREFRQLFVLC